MKKWKYPGIMELCARNGLFCAEDVHNQLQMKEGVEDIYHQDFIAPSIKIRYRGTIWAADDR